MHLRQSQKLRIHKSCLISISGWLPLITQTINPTEQINRCFVDASWASLRAANPHLAYRWPTCYNLIIKTVPEKLFLWHRILLVILEWRSQRTPGTKHENFTYKLSHNYSRWWLRWAITWWWLHVVATQLYVRQTELPNARAYTLHIISQLMVIAIISSQAVKNSLWFPPVIYQKLPSLCNCLVINGNIAILRTFHYDACFRRTHMGHNQTMLFTFNNVKMPTFEVYAANAHSKKTSGLPTIYMFQIL
jgi:hypothetical protein